MAANLMFTLTTRVRPLNTFQYLCGIIFHSINHFSNQIFAGVTILLSQTVFSLLVGNVITKTSEAVPLLGISTSTFSNIYNFYDLKYLIKKNKQTTKQQIQNFLAL